MVSRMNCALSISEDEVYQETPDPALNHFIQNLAQRLPAMAPLFRQPKSDELVSSRDNQVLIDTLYRRIKQNTPEAGRFYWAAQTWNMLCWQPIILMVSSVHLSDFQLSLSQVGQRLQGDFVGGLSLPSNALLQSASLDFSLEHRLKLGAYELETFLNVMLDQLAALYPINRKLASRLFADRLLSTLLQLQQSKMLPLQGAKESNQQIIGFAQQWLQALHLEDASGLMRIPLSKGGGGQGKASQENRDQPERLALDRKGCCQHFRRSDSSVCASCPRHKLDVRVALIKASWSTG